MAKFEYLRKENTLGGRLRFYRETQNMSMTKLAKLLEISQGSLSDIENNKTKPSATPIKNIIHKTDIDVYWLFTGSGTMLRENTRLSEIASDKKCTREIEKKEDSLENAFEKLKRLLEVEDPEIRAALIDHFDALGFSIFLLERLSQKGGQSITKGRMGRIKKIISRHSPPEALQEGR